MSKKKKILYICAGIYFLITFGVVTFPSVTAKIDTVEPHIMGLPCFQWFILASAFAMAIGLIIWFILDCKLENEEWAAQDALEAKNQEVGKNG